MTWSLRKSWHGAHPWRCTTRSSSIPPRRRGSAPKRRLSCGNGSSQSWATTCVNRWLRSTYASKLLRRRSKDPEFLEDLSGLRASSRRMSRMIEQILDFTRSRLGGGLELVFAPMDLREALVPIVDELRAAQPSATIQLQCPEAARRLGSRPPRASVFEPDRQCARPRRSGQAGHGDRGRRSPPCVGPGAQRRPTHSARTSVRALQPVPHGRAFESEPGGARPGSLHLKRSDPAARRADRGSINRSRRNDVSSRLAARSSRQLRRPGSWPMSHTVARSRR